MAVLLHGKESLAFHLIKPPQSRVTRAEANCLVDQLQRTVWSNQKIVDATKNQIALDGARIERKTTFPLNDCFLVTAFRHEDPSLGTMGSVVFGIDAERPSGKFIGYLDGVVRIAALRGDDREDCGKRRYTESEHIITVKLQRAPTQVNGEEIA